MKVLKLLLFLLILIFPLGQLTKIPLGIAEVNLYLQDLIIFPLVIFWLVWHLKRKKAFIRPPLFWPIIAFSLCAWLSLLVNLPRLNSWEAVVSFLYLLRWVFYAGVYFVVYEIADRRFFGFLYLAGLITAILGFLQYFLYPNLRNLSYLGWDPHYYRLFGSFFDPGFVGVILVLTLILLTCQPQKGRVFWWGLTYLALALTYARSAYLAFMGGMALLAYFKKSLKLLVAVSFLVLVTIFLIPRFPSEGTNLGRQKSVEARFLNWQQSLAIFRDSPIFGVGFNAYRYAQRDKGFIDREKWQETHAGAGGDSSLLFVLATTGILGFLTYLWLLGEILKYHLRNPLIVASLGAVLIHSFFNNSLFYPWVMLWLWILLGVSTKLRAYK